MRQHYIGSVLNGGGGWPGGNKAATAAQWLALAEAYHQASMGTDMATPVPMVWGTDAVHGHNNVMGATLFPHNIGLGAADNPALEQEIGEATARAVRATGIGWAFAPTLAVALDGRWGRTYESFSSDPARVARLGGANVQGLQQGLAACRTLGVDSENRPQRGQFLPDLQALSPAMGQKNGEKWTAAVDLQPTIPKSDRLLGPKQGVLATAKHFMGDGGTEGGMDQGLTHATPAQLFAVHGAGYTAALAQGVQAGWPLQQLARHGVGHGAWPHARQPRVADRGAQTPTGF